MSSISSPTSVYKSYATMRILKVNSDAIDDICHEKRKSNKGWTQTRVVNMALLQFFKWLPEMTPEELEKLFLGYTKALEKQKKSEEIKGESIKESAIKINRRLRYAKKA